MPPVSTPPEREPVYWFVLAERAIHRGDHEAARRAIEQLARLGVEMRYVWPPRRESEAAKPHA